MTRQWSEWREHTAGETCPIPDAKAGGFWIMQLDGYASKPEYSDAIECAWHNITHYRVLLPEPVKDWESVARELSEAAYEAKLQIEYLEHRFVITGTGRATLAKINAALNTYEEMKK
jgi:hypothetical protein